MTDSIHIQESEYDAILRQPIAVIDKTRAAVATTICSAIGTAHWEIGKLLHDKKVESKHGSGVVNQLIVPQDELKKVVAEEMKAFGKELPHRTKVEERLSQEHQTK